MEAIKVEIDENKKMSRALGQKYSKLKYLGASHDKCRLFPCAVELTAYFITYSYSQ